jgi:type IV secretory pathway VirB2 component (pilin)
MSINNENNKDILNNETEQNTLNKHLLSSIRKRIIIFLIVSIFMVNSLIIFSEGNTKKVFGDLTNIVTTVPGIIIGIIILTMCGKKTIFSNIKNRALLSLIIGLFIWLFANSLWAYYEFGLGIHEPFPSYADPIWLFGYFFFGYYFFVMHSLFKRQGEGNTIIYVSLTTGIALGYLYVLTFGVAEIVSAEHHVLTTTLSILYPILDGALLIPSISLLWYSKNNDSTSLLWVLISLSMILFIVGDTYYGYGTVMGLTDLVVTSIFYNAGYLAIAFGLYWLYKLHSMDKTIINLQNHDPKINSF